MSWRVRTVCLGFLVIAGLVGWAVIARATAPTQNTDKTEFDALIVLGYKVDSDGNPAPTQQARVAEAVREYERGVAPRIIFTGGPAHNQYVEAEVMARDAEAQGIPASVIFEDRKALDTIQNACYSVGIMKSHGWHSAEIVSSGYHLPRAALIFNRLPVEWRVHRAPPLDRQSPAVESLHSVVETIKTLRYLLWASHTESCAL